MQWNMSQPSGSSSTAMYSSNRPLESAPIPTHWIGCVARARDSIEFSNAWSASAAAISGCWTATLGWTLARTATSPSTFVRHNCSTKPLPLHRDFLTARRSARAPALRARRRTSDLTSDASCAGQRCLCAPTACAQRSQPPARETPRSATREAGAHDVDPLEPVAWSWSSRGRDETSRARP